MLVFQRIIYTNTRFRRVAVAEFLEGKQQHLMSAGVVKAQIAEMQKALRKLEQNETIRPKPDTDPSSS